MNKKPINPLAFPVHTEFQYPYSEGMTLRDYFAAKAVGSIISKYTMYSTSGINWDSKDAEPGVIAEYAYKMADAMLREREKEANNE